MPPAIQVCVAHGVIAWELGQAKSSELRTENFRQGEIGLKDANCCINLYVHITQLSVQSVQIAEWYGV